jgi:hypothetical protein
MPENKSKRPRKYRVQRFGGSYYLCIPTFLVTKEMLRDGVYINVLEFNRKAGITVLQLTPVKPFELRNEAGSNGKHPQGS